jgi:hypothetical protein
MEEQISIFVCKEKDLCVQIRYLCRLHRGCSGRGLRMLHLIWLYKNFVTILCRQWAWRHKVSDPIKIRKHLCYICMIGNVVLKILGLSSHALQLLVPFHFQTNECIMKSDAGKKSPRMCPSTHFEFLRMRANRSQCAFHCQHRQD